MPELKALPYLDALTPYQGSANKVEDKGAKIRLCYNEGAFGPSPRAVEALRAAAFNQHRYPDMGYDGLRAALAARHRLEAARIVCGAGSDDLIALLTRAFMREGDEAICSQYGFSMYPVAIRVAGGVPVPVPENNFETGLDAMLKAVTPRTKIVFLANPNNPTGSWLRRGAMAAFLHDLPENILVAYDAAYAEYMDDEDYSDGFEWVRDEGRVCVLRTFSKIHGLAGLRVGWCYGSQVIADALNRVRNPFNLALGAEAAALAALRDEAFVESCRAHTIIWREKLFDHLMQCGFHPYPSKGNFVLAGLHSAAHVKDLLKFLEERDILIRPMGGYGLPDCVRISVGREEEMKALFKALNEFTGTQNDDEIQKENHDNADESRPVP